MPVLAGSNAGTLCESAPRHIICHVYQFCNSVVFVQDCKSAECVTLQCEVQPLALRASAVIEVHARLWKYSFLKVRMVASGLFHPASFQALAGTFIPKAVENNCLENVCAEEKSAGDHLRDTANA